MLCQQMAQVQVKAVFGLECKEAFLFLVFVFFSCCPLSAFSYLSKGINNKIRNPLHKKSNGNKSQSRDCLKYLMSKITENH